MENGQQPTIPASRVHGEVTTSFLSDRLQYCSCCEEYIATPPFWTFSAGPQYIDCQACNALLATDIIYRTNWMWWTMIKLCPAVIGLFLFAIGFQQTWAEDLDIAHAFGVGGAGALGGLLFGLIVACIVYFPAQIVVDLVRWIYGKEKRGISIA